MYFAAPGILEPQEFIAPGMVKSIELVTLDLSGGVTDTVALTKSQDDAKCVPFPTSETALANSQSIYHAIDIDVWDDAGTPKVTVSRNTTSAAAYDIKVWVVEFGADINVDKKSFASSGNIDIDITAVTLANAFAVSYHKTTATGSGINLNSSCSFVDTDTVRVHTNASGTNTGHVYVVEDDTAGGHFSVQTFDIASLTALQADDTISTVDVDKTFICGGTYTQSGTAYPGEVLGSIQLANSTTVRREKYRFDAGKAVGARGFVVETLYCGVEQVPYEFGTGETTKTLSLTTSVDLAKATIIACNQNVCPNSYDTGFDQSGFGKAHTLATLVSAGASIQLDRSGSGALSDPYVQVVEWAME
jgi:hypothetical protein